MLKASLSLSVIGFVVGSPCSLVARHVPYNYSLADQIVTLSRDPTLTPTYSHDYRMTVSSRACKALVSVAGDRTSALREAFAKLDRDRGARDPLGRISEDAIFRTGALITILAFDERSFKLNGGNWKRFKGPFYPGPNMAAYIKSKPITFFLSWPWERTSGSWKLCVFYRAVNGYSNGSLLLFWDTYSKRFSRRAWHKRNNAA